MRRTVRDGRLREVASLVCGREPGDSLPAVVVGSRRAERGGGLTGVVPPSFSRERPQPGPAEGSKGRLPALELDSPVMFVSNASQPRSRPNHGVETSVGDWVGVSPCRTEPNVFDDGDRPDRAGDGAVTLC